MASLRPPDEPMAAMSSSPAFGTPVHPIIPAQARAPPPPPAFARPALQPAAVLAVNLPPQTLRPVAFRTFTKKHNLTLNTSALQALAKFIGTHCGTGWREDGTGEKVLEEAARLWKAESGGVIVEDGDRLKTILKTVEGGMSGGRLAGQTSRKGSAFASPNDSAVDLGTSDRPALFGRESSFGMSSLQVEEPEEEGTADDPRAWLKVTSASSQPRFTYDVDKKHFVQLTTPPALFPSPSHKTAVFKDRYNIIHQRLLRNPAFQAPSISNSATANQHYKITPIANLLGRGGTGHLLLAQLVIAPSGNLALNDPTGSIFLDLQHAVPLQGSGSDAPHFCPGMIVLVDGVYEEDWSGAGSSGLGNTGGVGGTIGGRFLGFGIGGPPVERRDVSLGINVGADTIGGGFGWTDFLGQGSERAVGERMRRLETRLLAPEGDLALRNPDRAKMAVLSEVTLDQPTTLSALRKVFERYTENPPLAFLLIGNFISLPALAGAQPDNTNSIAYKEAFNSLASVLRDFPAILKASNFIFVPGDNDAWASSFSAGASAMVPQPAVPELFTSRVQRASIEGGDLSGDEVAQRVSWTSNPSRITLFGPAHGVLVFRDDLASRLRRNAIRVGQCAQAPSAQPEQSNAQDEDILMSAAQPSTDDVETQPQDNQTPELAVSPPDSYSLNQAKKTILSLLPQSTLVPFLPSSRPIHWDHGTAFGALSLYPLPHTLILADPEGAEEGYAVTFEGCHVFNPGRLVGTRGGRRRRVGWGEYDLWTKRGVIKDDWMTG